MLASSSFGDGGEKNWVKTKDFWQPLKRNAIKTKENSLAVSVNTNEGLIKYQVTTTKLYAGWLPGQPNAWRNLEFFFKRGQNAGLAGYLSLRSLFTVNDVALGGEVDITPVELQL